MSAKIVGIDNSVWGKPMLIKQNNNGNLEFEELPLGITRLEVDNSKSVDTNNKLSDTEHINA
tara:strand:- start:949 stop:1134 length:186 start_codon:yes stop_codon:yes gene_type:complete